MLISGRPRNTLRNIWNAQTPFLIAAKVKQRFLSFYRRNSGVFLIWGLEAGACSAW